MFVVELVAVQVLVVMTLVSCQISLLVLGQVVFVQVQVVQMGSTLQVLFASVVSAWEPT